MQLLTSVLERLVGKGQELTQAGDLHLIPSLGLLLALEQILGWEGRCGWTRWVRENLECHVKGEKAPYQELCIWFS